MQDIAKLDLMIADVYGLKVQKWFGIQTLATGLDPTTSSQDPTESVNIYYRYFTTDDEKDFTLVSYSENLKFYTKQALIQFENDIIDEISKFDYASATYAKYLPKIQLTGYLLLRCHTD